MSDRQEAHDLADALTDLRGSGKPTRQGEINDLRALDREAKSFRRRWRLIESFQEDFSKAVDRYAGAGMFASSKKLDERWLAVQTAAFNLASLLRREF